MAEKHVKEKPFTIAQLRYIYEQAMPDLLKERERHMALLRGGLDDTPQSWFPDWSEEDAEYSYEVAISLRHRFDPDLKKSYRWAVVWGNENPEVRRLIKQLNKAHNRILEILVDWKDMTLLSIAIVTWNVIVDKLIKFWAGTLDAVKGD